MVNPDQRLMGHHASGIEARAYIATAAMQGLLANPEYLKQAAVAAESADQIVAQLTAELAVITADALIARLNEKEKPNEESNRKDR